MPRDAGCLTDGDTNYDNLPRTEPKSPHQWLMDASELEPKRPHQWLMDASELELFSNKRQEMEAVCSRPGSGIPNGSISPWDNSSIFQTVSGQFPDHLFGSDVVRTSNIIDRSIPTGGMGNLNAELMGFENQLGIRSSVSMSHTIQDSSFCINYGGIRRVKVNQVGASDNGMPVSMGHHYSRGDNKLSIGAAYNKPDNNMSLGQTYDKGKGIAISMDPTFAKPNVNFASMGHTFNKGDGSFMLMGHNIYKGSDNSLPISQPFDKGDGAFESLGHNGFEKGNASVMSASHDNKDHENFISMVSNYNKDNGNFISVCPFYDKGDENSISMRPISVAASTYVIPRGTTGKKGIPGNMSIEENCINGETGTNSFGDFQNEPETNPSGGMMTIGYDLMANQPSVQTSAPGLENVAVNKIVAPAAKAKTKATPKSKEPKPLKKVAVNNNFPANVKSLLSTGILDGVPVKYVSWSREHSLKGIVKETGYLCGCKDCKFSKTLNAYELERHAGCKTKHPNNHIYFQNGKTIYAVVQELKNTPQEMLFDAIQMVTGSPINQKNFCSWKASYHAATRELQRIFGKDKLTLAS